MPIKREFLGWDAPSLPAAVDYLIGRFGSARALDLENVTIAVPGGRAGRRLEEILIGKAQARRIAWVPPTIITAGRLPEQFYEAARPFADDLVQQLAWVEALKTVEPTGLANLMPSLPDADDLMAWLALGRMLARLHRELAAENLNFRQVAEKGVRIQAFREADRWIALSEIQLKYLSTLDRLGLWDIQSARLFAIEHRECRTRREIVLLGTVDLNVALREMLDQVSDQVTSIIFAPEALADRFDTHGCLRPEAWVDSPIHLTESQIEVVDGPAEQAGAVVGWLASLDARYPAEQITVGVPDARLVPYLDQQLEQSDVSVRYGVGTPTSQSGPYRLLSVVSEYIENRSYSAFAAMLRHPAIHAWLQRRNILGDWLTELDTYYAWHLPSRIDADWLKSARPGELLGQVFTAIDGLLSPLCEKAGPLGDWAEPILGLLVEVFGQERLNPTVAAERTVLAACEAFHNTLGEYREIHADLAPKVSGGQAIRLTLRSVDSGTIAAPPNPDAVELLGWLELPLDDAPALVVTQLNEGTVPASLNADLFLPNQLRRALGIEDNDRRFARDVYALTLLAANRTDLHLIAGRRSSEGDPLAPSRLLFACDEETTARRAVRFFEELSETPKLVLPDALRAGRDRSNLVVPCPERLPQRVRSMRVTEFRDYLACPYRYYLRHQLRLEQLVDSAEELDGRTFGSLAHDILADFGASDVCNSSDAREIEQFLNRTLQTSVYKAYGKKPLAAIAVQAEQLRIRLMQFAQWQADWARQGWQIKFVEVDTPPDTASLDVDGQKMYLRGRIDRIDHHPATDRWIVFDYKTSDSAKKPEQVHQRRTDWVDLQLPLYRHLLPALEIEGSVELGYLVLPKDVSKVGPLIAGWTEEDCLDADETARHVVRSIWDERFWPPTSPPPAFAEEYAAICQDSRIVTALAAEASDGESL